MAADEISACASARKAGRVFGSCRKRSDVYCSSSACSGAAATQPAPLPREFRSANRRSDGRGFAASGFTSAPLTAGKSAFSARKHKNNRKKYMKTRKALENGKQMMYNHQKEKYKNRM